MSKQPTRSRIRAFLPVVPPQIIAVLSQDNVKAGARTMSGFWHLADADDGRADVSL
jgi:hypothetical protein